MVTPRPKREVQALVDTLPNRLAEMQTISDTLAKVLVGTNGNTGCVLDTLQHIGRCGKQKRWWTHWLTGYNDKTFEALGNKLA